MDSPQTYLQNEHYILLMELLKNEVSLDHQDYLWIMDFLKKELDLVKSISFPSSNGNQIEVAGDKSLTFLQDYTIQDLIRSYPIHEFTLENDEYMWFHFEPQFSRRQLDNTALGYGINPRKYKNKTLLTNKLISLWEEYFLQNPTFLSLYKHYYKPNLELIINNQTLS